MINPDDLDVVRENVLTLVDAGRVQRGQRLGWRLHISPVTDGGLSHYEGCVPNGTLATMLDRLLAAYVISPAGESVDEWLGVIRVEAPRADLRLAGKPAGRISGIGLWQIADSPTARPYTPDESYFTPQKRTQPPAPDPVMVDQIKRLVAEWERRAASVDWPDNPFIGGARTAFHEVVGELKAILDGPAPVSMVSAHGWPERARTGVPCPRCSAEIVYNGNYFCSNLPRDCQWAMSSDDAGALSTRCREGLLANRAKL